MENVFLVCIDSSMAYVIKTCTFKEVAVNILFCYAFHNFVEWHSSLVECFFLNPNVWTRIKSSVRNKSLILLSDRFSKIFNISGRRLSGRYIVVSFGG